MAALIELLGIGKEYPMPGGNVQALQNVTLQFDDGEFAAVVGTSGSGKSTLLYLIGLMISPTAGMHRFAGQAVEKLSDKARTSLRGKQIGFVFQSFHLVPQLTVLKNVLLAARYNGSLNGDAAPRARDLIAKVGLAHRMHHRPAQLSNGEMQRVAIARALLGNPRLILADEPTGNLDERTGNDIFDLLESLHREGHTVIIVTHDLRLAARTSRQVTLRNGEVVS
ncbi:MAG: ABC transporter ATP-binding protein [Planctomycetota bacterium]